LGVEKKGGEKGNRDSISVTKKNKKTKRDRPEGSSRGCEVVGGWGAIKGHALTGRRPEK